MRAPPAGHAGVIGQGSRAHHPEDAQATHRLGQRGECAEHRSSPYCRGRGLVWRQGSALRRNAPRPSSKRVGRTASGASAAPAPTTTSSATARASCSSATGLPPPDVSDRWQPHGAHQAATDDLVSRHLPDQPGQDRAVVLGTQASTRGELPDCLAVAPEDQPGHGPAGRYPSPSGAVLLDDAYLGGERAGGKAGRGSENKLPFVAAVSLNEQGRPTYLKLHLVSGFTLQAIGNWAKANLAPGTLVSSDGLGCLVAVSSADCIHMPTVVGVLKPRDLPEFKWVNTMLGNLKTTLAGAFHSLKYRKYAEHYLAGFAYRFNRRFDLRGLVARLIVDVARCKPAQETVVRSHAEAGY